ncbi:radical SAM protein, partial [Desulfococcaceae bacterium HSG7]|nr:radical SAM protein [Desulfococcaceae bacterium HSG7]
MSDILLIQPPIHDFYITYKRTVPYGLASIAASLTQNGFSVSLFDSLATARSRDIAWPEEMAYLKPFYGMPDSSPFALFHRFRHFGYSFEYIGKTARESGAFLVGISALFTTYIECARQTARVVKKWLPDCKIVMGGHHPTTMPEDMMACEAVDFVIRGEGEAAMPLLAKALKNGSTLDTVPGIVFRKPDGNVYQAEPAIMDDPDAFPRPSLRYIKHNFYKRGKKRSAVIVTSRGCPLKCTYCCTGKDSFLRFRQKSVTSVLEEIENAVLNYDARFIDFEDENLSLNKPWFMKLLDAITDRFQNYNLELRAMNGLFPPSLDKDVIQAMQTAGFKTLNLGLCTTDKAQLHRFQRPDVSAASDRALNLAEDYDMQAVAYIIAGAPYQDALSTVADLIYLAQRRVLAGLSVFYPAPGSRDFKLTQDLG